MFKPKHTGNPWRAFHANSSICVAGSEPIMKVEDFQKHFFCEVFGENKEENAKLIESSPDMFDLLNSLIDNYGDSVKVKELVVEAEKILTKITRD